MTLRPTDRLTVDGKTINRRTKNMLREAAAHLGVSHIPLTQGSYNVGGVALSAGTHDGGGAVDTPAHVFGHSPREVVLALRMVGFAAWHRTPAQGPWPEHIHAVAIGDRELAPAAARQVDAYRAGRNGLASNLIDDGPRVEIRVWEEVRRLPLVSLSDMQRAWLVDRRRVTGLHPRQTRRVQRALGFRIPSGRWGGKTRKAFPDRGPTLATLRALGAGRFRVTD